MIISKTPLRISFVGGGSDLKEYYKTGYGAVVSTAINKFIYITVKESFDDTIRVSYSKTEFTKDVNKIEHNIIREAMKLTGVTKGVEIVYIGDIPLGTVGTGLAASSGIAVGTLNALHAFKGEHVSADQLAKEACRIEIEILKQPIGKQDQYIVAHGGFNRIRFNADESVFVTPVILKPKIKEKLNRKLMLFYTGLASNSKGVLTEQKKNTNQNLSAIEKMVGLTEEMLGTLRKSDISKFGELLHTNWEHKKKLASKICNDEIDAYYNRARRAGAAGGKILGSGGGGFLLFYCDEESQDKVRSALKTLREVPFSFEPEGSKIMYVSDN